MQTCQRAIHERADPGIAQTYPQRRLESQTAFASPAATRAAAAIQVHQQQSQTRRGRGMSTLVTAPQSRTLSRQARRMFRASRCFKWRLRVPRHCAQLRRPSFTTSSAHKDVPSTDPSATTPWSRGCPYFAGRLRTAFKLTAAFTGPVAACAEERDVVLPRATPSA